MTIVYVQNLRSDFKENLPGYCCLGMVQLWLQTAVLAMKRPVYASSFFQFLKSGSKFMKERDLFRFTQSHQIGQDLQCRTGDGVSHASLQNRTVDRFNFSCAPGETVLQHRRFMSAMIG